VGDKEEGGEKRNTKPEQEPNVFISGEKEGRK
jgi:hypothetical protein